MGCNSRLDIKKIKTKITTKRCNEMIDDFEKNIADMFNKDLEACRYKGEERDKLISLIKQYPNDCWVVTEKGISHFEL